MTTTLGDAVGFGEGQRYSMVINMKYNDAYVYISIQLCKFMYIFIIVSSDKVFILSQSNNMKCIPCTISPKRFSGLFRFISTVPSGKSSGHCWLSRPGNW